jgi:hypothetical protein
VIFLPIPPWISEFLYVVDITCRRFIPDIEIDGGRATYVIQTIR